MELMKILKDLVQAHAKAFDCKLISSPMELSQHSKALYCGLKAFDEEFRDRLLFNQSILGFDARKICQEIVKEFTVFSDTACELLWPESSDSVYLDSK